MDLQKRIRLASYTTFNIGGVARYFVDIRTKAELKRAVSFAKKSNLPIFVIGEGSDILISDKDFDGLVIRFVNKNVEIEDSFVTSGSGVKWDDLVRVVVDKNLQGIECLSGIPGTVGAAPVQNIGAYGQELKDIFEKALIFDVQKEKFLYFNKKDCNFSYRESVFKKEKGRYIIFEVILKLKKNGEIIITYESLKNYLLENKIVKIDLENVRNAVLKIRSEKLEDPKRIPNAGSFFKNPIVSLRDFQRIKNSSPDIKGIESSSGVKLFAGWLIEKAGWKGRRFGAVGVSSQNALVLINFNDGTADQMKELAEKIIDDVNRKFGIELEPEVQFVNF